MSYKLLTDESPVQVLPSLACVLGLERAIIIQQIHWLGKGENSGTWSTQGHKFIWKTAREMSAEYFPFWKPQTIQKHIRHLEQRGLLQSYQWHKNTYNRVKFYRINYEHLNTLLQDAGFDGLASWATDKMTKKPVSTDA